MKDKYHNFVLGLLLFLASISSSLASEDYLINELNLVITFEEKALYEIAPRLLVTQALKSLPRIEKEVNFLCKRNHGYIQGLSYSMLCYTSIESGEYINILGEARYEGKLWNYEAKLPKGNLPNNIIVMVEALSQFTYNKFKNVNAASGSDASTARPF